MQPCPKTAWPREIAALCLHADAEAVRAYAELTADFNPIHLDAEFAGATPFGAPIIHGTLGLNLAVQAIERVVGVVPAGLAIEVRFSRPVPVGTTIRAGGTLRDAATGTYEIFVETEAGERAVEGTCTLGALG